MKTKFISSFFIGILFYSMILCGCASQKTWVYRSNNYSNEPKKYNKTVVIMPFIDARENINKNNSAFFYIPLVPFGWQNLEIPEGESQHLNSTLWTNYNPKEDFAKALAQELQSANLFQEVYFSFSKDKSNLLIQGKIINTKYKGKIFGYGFSLLGPTPFFWLLGAPVSTVTNELTIELTVRNSKDDNVLFSKSYTAPKYRKVSWIYSIRSDFNYSEMLRDIYKQFVEDYKNQIKPSNPQSENQKTDWQNSPPAKSKTDRIRELKIMFNEKLISKEEYETMKKQILNEKE